MVLRRLLSPVISHLQTAPKIAIAPLLLPLLGLDLGRRITLIAIATCLPGIAGTAARFATREKPYQDLAKILHLSTWQRFRRVKLHFPLPPILAGLRIASTQAVTAAAIGELIGATYSLGYLLSL